MEVDKKKQEEDRPEETAKKEVDPIVESLNDLEANKAVQREKATKLLASQCKITTEQIAEWKRKCGRIETQSIRGKWFIYRGLSRLEWQQLTDDEAKIETAGLASDTLKREARMVNKCLLFPTQLDISAPAQAGVASVLFAHILNFSGFEPDLPEAIEL